jgi:hypothetical protein
MAEEFVDLSSVNLSETFEPTVAPVGEETELRIVSMLKANNKSGNPYMMPFFEVPSDPYCKEFGDYIELPGSHMSPKEMNKAKLRILEFSKAFDIDFSTPIDIKADIVGKEGYAILGMGTDQDGSPVNKIKKYLIG